MLCALFPTRCIFLGVPFKTKVFKSILISKPINPELASIFMKIGDAEESGKGINTIVNTYSKDVFEYSDTCLIINIPYNKKVLEVMGNENVHQNVHDIINENPILEEITLNSSPYGLPFYLAIGFIPLSDEQEMNGIKFTPMKYIIKR